MKPGVRNGVRICALLLTTLSAWHFVSASSLGGEAGDLSDRVGPLAPEVGPVTVVLNSLADRLPPRPEGDGKVVTGTAMGLAGLIEANQWDRRFQGTLVVTDDPSVPADWPPTDRGATHVRLTFHDLDYYTEVWRPRMEAGWTPGLLNEEMAFPPPGPDEVIFTIDWWQRIDEENTLLARIAVRAEDGAVAIVSMSWGREPIRGNRTPSVERGTHGTADRKLDRCDAGPWWQLFQLCCHSQAYFCDLVGWLLGCTATECTTCFNQCMFCTVDDPCHACDPCGLTWLICKIVPGASC